MKYINKNIIAAALVTVTSASAMAQASYSGYYLDNYTHRYQLNPAMTDEDSKGFVAFPVLGNMDIAMQGNLHVSSLLFPKDGKTLLFTNPEISTSEVMKGIHDNNKLGVGVDLDILGVGFKAFGGQNAVTLSAVVDANVGVPGSIFSLLKEGVENKSYDLSDVRVSADAYAKLQFNHSRDIKWVPGLRAGAAFKLLFGLAHADGGIDQADLTLGQDAWTARTKGDIYASMKRMNFKYRYDDDGMQYIDGVENIGVGVTGFGIGFDLGATYEWRDFKFNLALLDLGFISWSNTLQATTNGIHQINTNDYTFGVESGEADATWDKMKSDLEMLYQLQDGGSAGTRTRSLRTTLNWGAEYTLPYYRRLTFGFLNSTRFNGHFTTTDFRISANVRPVDCLSASANLVAGTYGAGFGWLVNLNVSHFNLFVGMDHTLGKLAKQGVPLNSNAEFNFGINFPL